MKHLAHSAVALLVTRRLTALITEDKITEGIRDKITRRYPPHTHKLGYLVTCRKCSSMWAAVCSLLLLALGNVPVVRVLTHALALSEASILADRYLPADGFDL